MSALLQQLDIFELRPLITNLSCKLSTVTNYDAHKQLLCLVSEDNDIVLRYTSEGGQEVLKLISWFRRTARVIHDVCFDPTGTWLLVLCFDNTLHIVPALAVVDRTFAEPAKNALPQQPYSTLQVTSYIIPFVGPHECPNSKKCPNHEATTPNAPITPNAEVEEQDMAEDLVPGPGQPNAELPQQVNADVDEPPTMEAFSHDIPASMLGSVAPPNQREDKTGNTHVMASSFMASSTCPYPLSVIWWQTMEGVQRAIIGYSDGSVCFVGLSPNCPFVASTSVSSGSVVKFLICKDLTFESVILLITTSMKQQFKMLLQQKAINYLYPGDISPITSQQRESDWQIVMPLKTTNSAASDSASDHSQVEEEVFVSISEQNQMPPNNTTAITTSTISSATTTITAKNSNEDEISVDTKTTTTKSYPTAQGSGLKSSSTNVTAATNTSNQAAEEIPPTYAQAVSRQVEAVTASKAVISDTITTATATTITTASSLASNAITAAGAAADVVELVAEEATTSVSTTIEIDDYLGRAGILPAARARLASLKSLGSKKLNALKMRLSDSRQKMTDEREFSLLC